MGRIYDVTTFVSKYLFANIIEIVTMFIKTIFKDSKKFKRIRTQV